MIDGLFLRWARAKGGYRLVKPDADAKSISTTNKRIYVEAHNKEIAEGIRKMRGGGYLKPPVFTRKEREVLEMSGGMGGPPQPEPLVGPFGRSIQLGRLVPQGDPQFYTVDFKKAEEAYRYLRGEGQNPANWVEFCNRYGALSRCPPTRKGDRGPHKSLDLWREGESEWEFGRKYGDMVLALHMTRGGGRALADALDASDGGAFRLRLYKPVGSSHFVPRFEPQSLLTMLWFILARSAVGKTSVIFCENCQKPIVVGTGTGRRMDTKFCSDACKQANHRRSTG